MEEDELVPGIDQGTMEIRLDQDFAEVREEPTYITGIDLETGTAGEPWAYYAVNADRVTGTTIRGVGDRVTAITEAGQTIHRQMEERLQEEVNDAFRADTNAIPATYLYDMDMPRYARNIDDIRIINLGERDRHREQEQQLETIRELAREQGLLPIDNTPDEPTITEGVQTAYIGDDGITTFFNPGTIRPSISFAMRQELITYMAQMQQENKIPISVYEEFISKIYEY